MIEVDIPGYGALSLRHLVCDFNGTLALDGKLIDGVAYRISELSRLIHVHILTADTYGTAKEALASLPCALQVVDEVAQDVQKLAYVQALRLEHVAAIGNGRNDRSTLASVALGIAVIGPEAAAAQALHAAHLISPDINTGLDLLRYPGRLIASLRS